MLGVGGRNQERLTLALLVSGRNVAKCISNIQKSGIYAFWQPVDAPHSMVANILHGTSETMTTLTQRSCHSVLADYQLQFKFSFLMLFPCSNMAVELVCP